MALRLFVSRCPSKHKEFLKAQRLSSVRWAPSVEPLHPPAPASLALGSPCSRQHASASPGPSGTPARFPRSLLFLSLAQFLAANCLSNLATNCLLDLLSRT